MLPHCEEWALKSPRTKTWRERFVSCNRQTNPNLTPSRNSSNATRPLFVEIYTPIITIPAYSIAAYPLSCSSRIPTMGVPDTDVHVIATKTSRSPTQLRMSSIQSRLSLQRLSGQPCSLLLSGKADLMLVSIAPSWSGAAAWIYFTKFISMASRRPSATLVILSSSCDRSLALSPCLLSAAGSRIRLVLLVFGGTHGALPILWVVGALSDSQSLIIGASAPVA